MKPELTKEYLESLFTYCEETGNLFYRKLVNGLSNDRINHPVGSIINKGRNNYLRCQIQGKKYQVHRLVFLMHHGYLPEIIDHIDRDTLNNRIENLRECTASFNRVNTNPRSDNTSGYSGITIKNGKYIVRIGKDGVREQVGTYDTLDEAITIRNLKVKELYNEDYIN